MTEYNQITNQNLSPAEAKVTCSECGEQLDILSNGIVWNAVFHNGSPLCRTCSTNPELFTFCNDCERILRVGINNGTHEVYLYDRYETVELCQYCYENNFDSCRNCGDSYDIHDRENYGRYDELCYHCYENDYFTCAGCGRTVHMDDYGSDGLCTSCESHNNPSILQYHHGHQLTKHYWGAHGPNSTISAYEAHPYLYGIEVESDNYNYDGSLSKCADRLHDLSKDRTLFYLEHDSSLENGLELVTMPCSLDFHRDHFPYGAIEQIITNHGGKAHDTTTCGLHIHFNKSRWQSGVRELRELRLLYLYEKFFDEFVIFSRRTGTGWLHMANKFDDWIFDGTPTKQKNQYIKNYGRYHAVNITNEHTVELRIFRGTIKRATIIAAIELVDFLAHLVSTTSTPKLQKLTWADISKAVKTNKNSYQYLPEYFKTKRLYGSWPGRK